MLKQKKKNRKFTLVKMCLGVLLLLYILLKNQNYVLIKDSLSRLDWSQLANLIVIAFLLIWLSCLKWQLFLVSKQKKIQMLYLIKLYIIGRFYNNFFPSMVGGDVARSYLLGKKINSQSTALASILLERLTGAVALILIIIMFSTVNYKLLSEPLVLWTVVGMSICIVLLILILMNRRIYQIVIERFSNYRLIGKFKEKFNNVYLAIGEYKNNRKVLVLAMIYSFGFHILTSVNVYVVCMAIQADVSFVDIALITPIILLVTSIPVSPNNVGWWEWCFGIYFGGIGIEMSHGVAAAIVLRAINLLQGVIGGILNIRA